MNKEKCRVGGKVVVEVSGVGEMIRLLAAKGFRVVGPVLRDGAIVVDKILALEDLPVGWTDEQDGGRYRLKKRDDDALFGYTVGPQSWKKYLFPPALRLWKAKRDGDGFQVEGAQKEAGDIEHFAFFGVRACELAAMAIQDKVFLGGAYVDPHYKLRRESVFIVAVQCGQAGGTCFCVSMNTGPKAVAGFDIALTEIVGDGVHYFVVEVGSEKGVEIVSEIPGRVVQEVDLVKADESVSRAASQMGRSMDTTGLKDLLYSNSGHAHWDEVAKRCLSCANCTMVCPTCFCSTVEDVTDLTGEHAERWRKWDSCFTMDFSYIHGGSVRASTKARYRQWLTHKLASWMDQFGSSGCVGCGRCISWCPVGIDLTQEVRAIKEGKNGKTHA